MADEVKQLEQRNRKRRVVMFSSPTRSSPISVETASLTTLLSLARSTARKKLKKYAAKEAKTIKISQDAGLEDDILQNTQPTPLNFYSQDISITVYDE